MTNKLDYNSEEVMKILNNTEYTDEQKKSYFEKYKSDLQVARKNEIKSRVNELAKKLPNITQEIYIDFLKKYEDDNLTKPFNVIEKEINEFEAEMTEKYNTYLAAQQPVEEPKEEEPLPMPEPEPVVEEEPSFEPDVNLTQPDIPISEEENSVLNEEPELLAKPLVADDESEAKDVMPENIKSLGEKGNASAIIISIIAIIIGAVVMYTIIKLN